MLESLGEANTAAFIGLLGGIILGLAARRVAGRALRPNEFSGGKRSKCFRILNIMYS